MKPLYSCASAALAAALVAACSGGAGGNASGGGDQSAKLVQTAQALENKLGAPGEKAQMPPADDPDVKAFDAEAEKALTTLGTPAMPVEGMDSFDRLCSPAAKITAAYVSAGLGAVGEGGLPTGDQAKVARMNENASRYMGQMLTPLLYSAHCTAVHIPPIDKELAKRDLSGKAAALAQVRNGAYGQFAGLLQMAASPDMQPAQRKRVIDVLSRDTGDLAIAFTQAQRQQASGIVDSAAAASPDVQAVADGLKSAIGKAPCGKLCAS